jgi:hypothetical protein
MERDTYEYVPDFVREVEAALAAGEPLEPIPGQEVTIKFGRGLMGTPFTSKNGKELVEIRIPNGDPTDTRPWETFVISPKMVHQNKFSNGLWMKLAASSTTKLSRSVRDGVDEAGKTIRRRETRTVSNTELKALMESYKTRDSVLGRLSEQKAAATAAPQKAAGSPARQHEESL